MKAVIFEAFGGIDKLKTADVQTPNPSDNEVLIAIEWAGVNPVDWKIREGLLQTRLPHEFPIIPGWDAAGKIAAIGKNVTNFNCGDEVYAYCRKPTVQWGTYAEYVCVEAQNVALKPKKISCAKAAAIPLVGLTAWQAIFDSAKLQNGETIFIPAGAGGVGSLAIQFAKNAGAKVLTTAREVNHPYVKKLGADFVVDYTKDMFASKIKSEFPNGVDVLFDTMGGDTLKQSLDLVKSGGRVVSLLEKIDAAEVKTRNIHASYVFVSPNGAQLKQIATLIDEGKVLAPTIEELPLEKAASAQEKVRSGHTQGKIVLKIK